MSRGNETDEGGLGGLDVRDGDQETDCITDTTQPVELPGSHQSSPLPQRSTIIAAPKAVELSEAHHPPDSDITVQTGTDTGQSAELSNGDKSLPLNPTIEADRTNKSDPEDPGQPLPADSALETSKRTRPRPRETLKEKKRRLREAQRLEAAKLEAEKPSKGPSETRSDTRSEKPSTSQAEKPWAQTRKDSQGSLQIEDIDDTPQQAEEAPEAESGASADVPPEQPRVKMRWRRRAEGEGPRTKAEQKAMRKAATRERMEALLEQHKRAKEMKKWPAWWPEWRIQKEALKAKFPDGWKPLRKLSPDACAGIRALHQQLPDEYTTPVLANKFKVSPESIRRILKRKRPPTEEQKEKQAVSWHERGKKIWARYAELGVKPPRMWRQEGVTRPPGFHEKRRRRAEWRNHELRVKTAERAEKLATEPGFEEETRRSPWSARG